MKVRRLRRSQAVRCMAWFACRSKDCGHHQYHGARTSCVGSNQVKYCPVVKGFVSDIPVELIDKDAATDPNLAFRIRKDLISKGTSN